MNTRSRIDARHVQLSGHVVEFDTPTAFFNALLGPVDQNEHVKTRLRFQVQQDSIARANHMEAAQAEWIAARRAAR